jgi:hypothetical protein
MDEMVTVPSSRFSCASVSYSSIVISPDSHDILKPRDRMSTGFPRPRRAARDTSGGIPLFVFVFVFRLLPRLLALTSVPLAEPCLASDTRASSRGKTPRP